jgi:hypothetical protein
LTDDQIREHDRVYQLGWSLTKNLLLLDGDDPSQRPGCLSRAFQLKPDDWGSLARRESPPPSVAMVRGPFSSPGPTSCWFRTIRGSVSHLALALLMNGQVPEAQAVAADAVGRAPADPIAKTGRRIIEDVAAERRPTPKSAMELG